MRSIAAFLILSSCAMGSRVVTLDAFYEIGLSSSTTEVVQQLGKPYAIHEKGDGVVEYEYIERIKIGGRDAEQRRYLIQMKDGVVIAKRVLQSSPLPYGFDSYEMQTTQSDLDDSES